MILIIIKHQLFLTTVNRDSNYLISIIILLFSNEIANIGLAAYQMNFSIIELIQYLHLYLQYAWNHLLSFFLEDSDT